MKLHLPMVAGLALLTGCAQLSNSSSGPEPGTPGGHESIGDLVRLVRADPAKKPLLARALMRGTVLIIPDPHSAALAALPFQQNEREFIPIFSDRKTFDEEAFGTGFAGKAIAIDGRRFAALLQGKEIVVLNPGHRPAIEFIASELTGVQ